MIVPYIILTVATAVEILSLTWLGTQISVLNTISLTMFTLLLGVINGRSYGEEWYGKMQWHLKSGTPPSDEVVNGAVMNVGSKLLLMPGLVTDVMGFLIVLPQTRFIAKNIALNLFKKKLSRREQWFFFQN
ncbi:MAG: FxsA family protein [Nitrospinaceae bacterium]